MIQRMTTVVKKCIDEVVWVLFDNDAKTLDGSNNHGAANVTAPRIEVDSDNSCNIFENKYDVECFEEDSFDKNEVEKYLSEPWQDRKNEDFDILAWWKVNSFLRTLNQPNLHVMCEQP